MMFFPERVLWRGREQPDRLAYRFFQGSAPPQTLTFGELARQAGALAECFRSQGWGSERVVLVCKSERHFVVAFYACLLAGVVAVPTAPPRRKGLHERLQLLAHDATATAIVCDSDDAAQALAGSGLAVVDMRCAPGQAVGDAPFLLEPIDGDALAFLQYTSGSTGDPKGVAVSHANLVDNSESIRTSMGTSASANILIGLPLFHDMGLVGGVLQSMYVGCTTSFISPAELVQYPERWLGLISSLRITTSGGPNFLYDLAAESVADADLAGLDLSCWEVAFCGAEPIRAGTVARFTQRFSVVGFRHDAFYPCYGMAEATLFISGSRVGVAPKTRIHDGVEVVCCGRPAAGTRVRIVDPVSHRELPDGDIGEIWVAGGGVAQGYWQRPAQSEQVFRASVHGEDTGTCLRTGDLGWMLDGELYVFGRLKDLIIANGRNHAPQDIEATVEAAAEALRPAGTAAFTVGSTTGADRLVVVAELQREWVRRENEWPAVVSAIRAAVREGHTLAVADVVLIRPGALPRTSSGKVRRSQCRADYLAGTFHPASAALPA
jgi:acyl-CoA synthetase (AMP-forming)/AMP-acid ligase II